MNCIISNCVVLPPQLLLKWVRLNEEGVSMLAELSRSIRYSVFEPQGGTLVPCISEYKRSLWLLLACRVGGQEFLAGCTTTHRSRFGNKGQLQTSSTPQQSEMTNQRAEISIRDGPFVRCTMHRRMIHSPMRLNARHDVCDTRVSSCAIIFFPFHFSSCRTNPSRAMAQL